MTPTQDKTRRSLIGKTQTRDNTQPQRRALDIMREAIAEAQRAQNDIAVIPAGFTEPTGFIKRQAASVRTLTLDTTTVTVGRDGQINVGNAANSAGEQISVADAIFKNSRAAQAGMGVEFWPHIEPVHIETGSETKVMAMVQQPKSFAVVNPAELQLIADDADQMVFAKLLTGVVASNNALTFTSRLNGASGNDISVKLVNPGTNNATLSVTVVGKVITVNLATGPSATATSTAAQIKTAIDDSTEAHALVSVSHTGASTGAGVAAVLAQTSLAGGVGAEIPLFLADIDRENQKAYGVTYRMSRRSQKMRGELQTAAEVLTAIFSGISKVVDKLALEAIIANSPESFTLAKAAASGVRVADLRGLVGTDGTGASFRADGQLVAAGIPAELTPVTTQTVVGQFDRALAVVGTDMTVLVNRLNVNGDVTISAWLSVDAVVPDAGRFWTVAA